MTTEDRHTHGVAEVHGSQPGPTVIAVGAVHGNEPAGLIAARRITDTVSLERGAFFSLVGNRAALARDVRFVDGDLNRRFRAERVSGLRDGTLRLSDSEDLDQACFLRSYDSARGRNDPSQPTVILDLHTFSATGTPFAMASPHPLARVLAKATALPTLVGLEQHLRGTMVELGIIDGLPVLAMEGGQHTDPNSVEVLGASIMAVLDALGMGPVGSPFARTSGVRDVSGPSTFEIVYRHVISPSDSFVMRPGYVNLAPVKYGEHLADDRRGPVLSPAAGHIVMPLYQGLGAEGFFIAVLTES